MSNIFWGIYKNLEREILSLAEMVHFTDNQIKVYSIRIADLLIRCNVEAESLIRELYTACNGASSAKVGEMLNFLNGEWQLEKKKVSIVAPNMHYSPEYTSFCPYHYNAKGENDFYSAYNAVKHDRANNFERYATIHFLLRAMGALFLLNIYYRNEVFSLHKMRLDNRMGSSVFSFEIYSRLKRFSYNIDNCGKIEENVKGGYDIDERERYNNERDKFFTYVYA